MAAERSPFSGAFNRRTFFRGSGVLVAGVASAALVGCGGEEQTPPEVYSPSGERAMHHHPTVQEKTVEPRQFLSLPFVRADIQKGFNISEGWLYSHEEYKIHGKPVHNGVDFDVPYGTDVVAPCDGYAISSYHLAWVAETDSKGLYAPRLYKDKPVRLSLGYFVQIYVPAEAAPPFGAFIQLAHLSDIDKSIPFSKPTRVADNLQPTNHKLTVEEILAGNPMVVKVQKGQTLGKVGYSGLMHGLQEDYDGKSDRPVVYKEGDLKSWDVPHLHLETFITRDPNGNKLGLRDIFDIYSSRDKYPTLTNKKGLGVEPLVFLDQNGLPALTA